MKHENVKKLCFMGVLLALGIVLPFVTMQVPRIGNMLLPMHIPVLLCGFLCGGPSGFLLGLILPIVRSLLFTAPPMMPTAVAMAAELATYGLVTGVFYQKLKNHRFRIYGSLIRAMILGRIVWGLVSMGLFRIMGNSFTWKLFALQGFVNALPGIVIQLILIPVIVIAVQRVQGQEEY